MTEPDVVTDDPRLKSNDPLNFQPVSEAVAEYNKIGSLPRYERVALHHTLHFVADALITQRAAVQHLLKMGWVDEEDDPAMLRSTLEEAVRSITQSYEKVWAVAGLLRKLPEKDDG